MTESTTYRQARDVALDFLRTLEARDLAKASAMLSPGARMVFPGGAEFSSLEALVGWAKDRYRHVGKRFERVDEMAAEDGRIVVCRGTLYGVWPDGGTFEGIRFIDWFLIRDGLIVEQHVWNDLAEAARRQETGARID